MFWTFGGNQFLEFNRHQLVTKNSHTAPQCVAAEATPHDAGDNPDLEAAVDLAPIICTSQARSQGRKRAAEAQQLRALRVAVAPRLQRRAVERALRQREAGWKQLRRRLQIVSAHAAGAEDVASGGGVQYKRCDGGDLRKE